MPMASNDSQPVHRVYVDGFWMDATPVTNAQFERGMAEAKKNGWTVISMKED